MVKKPKIVIIGAGMAGLTAANKLYTSNHSFDLCVVEAGARIGGRINTSEFGGDRIEMGATWIHGIGGSPLHKIAQDIGSLDSDKPWECMDGFSDEPITVAEGGFDLKPSIVEPISTLFTNLMDFAQGKLIEDESLDFYKWVVAKSINGGAGDGDKVSVGSFLRQKLFAYCEKKLKTLDEISNGYGSNWDKKLIQDSIFTIHENTQRTYTSAGDLLNLDFNAESEYVMFPGEEITIAKGYLTVIEHLASVLPPGMIQLGRRVSRIEWGGSQFVGNGFGLLRPVKLHFTDGSVMEADHVIVTVSLGVLKEGIGFSFSPPLPCFKTEAILRLGYGVVNKLFLQLSADGDGNNSKFPFLQMAFHRKDSESRNKKIPWWMRRTASICPIHNNSNVLLSWFAGEEALELESLTDEEIIDGVTTTVSSFLQSQSKSKSCNGEVKSEVKFSKVLRSKWGSDPLFLGSYSYVAVGSSGDDIDKLAEPLPESGHGESSGLQILFAGEATHRTHYSTTHGAFFSGLREANRLIQHYQSVGV